MGLTQYTSLDTHVNRLQKQTPGEHKRNSPSASQISDRDTPRQPVRPGQLLLWECFFSLSQEMVQFLTG